MSQTILIENNEDLRKIYSINLTTFVGTDVIIRKGADDAIELLRILPQISLVICKAADENGPLAQKIHRYITAEGLTTSMIVIGEDLTLPRDVVCLKQPITWELLVRQAARHLGVTLQEVTSKVRPDFIPVGVHYFYDIKKTPCDIYIRIKKGPQDFQYVKRIHSKDSFEKSDILRYEEQGLKEFFIPKDYAQYFTTFVTNNLVQKLEREDLSLEDRILTTANAHDIVRETVQSIGFDEASIELSDASINSMIKSVKNSPQVAELLKFLFSNKVSFAYQHSHLLALMCHYVLSKQSWYRAEHLETLSFVAFFSDVTLKSNIQMQISSMRDLAEANLTDEEKRQVMTHAKDAVDLLAEHPEANEYIRTVMLQSHGKTNGVGFEENPGEELHPLSKVFIVADQFVKTLLNPALPTNKRDILQLLGGRLVNPSYQKILKTLEQKFQ